jgi:hypothetical protein
MSNRDFRAITLRLESPINYVDLSFLKLEKLVKKLKIRFVGYVSQNTDVETLLIDIKSWNDDCTLLSKNSLGVPSNRAYTFIMPLVRQTQAENFYIDKDVTANATFDVIKDNGLQLANLEIHLLINGQYRPTEITSSNPVTIELYFSA